MSGRVRTTLSDGRRVTGFRKTLKVVTSRRRPCEMPPWRVTFVIPCPALPLSHPCVIGATVAVIGTTVVAEVVGANRDWALRQAEDLADKLGHHHRPLMARVTRDPEARPVIAPFERGEPGVVALGRHRVGNHVVGHVVEGNAMRRI